jgi:hypothetical protein
MGSYEHGKRLPKKRTAAKETTAIDFTKSTLFHFSIALGMSEKQLIAVRALLLLAYA